MVGHVYLFLNVPVPLLALGLDRLPLPAFQRLSLHPLAPALEADCECFLLPVLGCLVGVGGLGPTGVFGRPYASEFQE